MSLCRLSDSILLVIDLQPTFLAPIPDADKILARARFLIQCANLLGVPVVATEQVPDRMGGSESSILEAVGPNATIVAKTEFGACGLLNLQGKTQAILVGIETHICVNQTAQQLASNGIEVFVADDAVGCRSAMVHESALRRLRHAGVEVTHTESVAYEWMRDAKHPQFRQVLELVKAYPL
ncbi:MAG: hypothetical protein HONBIEJF_01565 [Fimbriimonadaceae bacterium]|nr:hypothetical protein [Fimbriimonadaceae bacterium]